MTIRFQRTRMVSVRLSPDEYDTLTREANEEQARTVSEFARALLLDAVNGRRSRGRQTIEDQLSTMDQHIEEAIQQLRRISSRLDKPAAHTPENHAALSASEDK